MHLMRCSLPQVVHSSTDCSAEALAAALAGLSLSAQPAEASEPAAASGHADGVSPGEQAAAPAADSEQGSRAGYASSSGREAAGSVFDPITGRDGKAGATRIMPGGRTGYFWWACLLSAVPSLVGLL